jgi:excisionase family DNA binding protein
MENPAVEEMKLMTVREVCDATRLSKSMVYKLLEQGTLHRVRLPGCVKVLIAESELKRYVSEGVAAGVSASS